LSGFACLEQIENLYTLNFLFLKGKAWKIGVEGGGAGS
jgi:hypothetical protein